MRTETPYHYLAQAVVNHPWAIKPETLQAMLGWLRAAVSADGAAMPSALSAAARTPQQAGGVAVLPLRGIITQHPDLFSCLFGGTSTVGFAAAFRRALSDESVKAIVIDVDSPGGSVFGIEELTREIYQARGRKPITAVANSAAGSAAYWIASAADEFVVTPSGMVGSIGIIFVHEEFTRMAEALGITVTLLSAGEFKTEGHPLEPLTDEAKDYVQSVLNQYYGAFVSNVARGRGVTPAQVREGFGQGRMLTAKDAQKAGMVDRIATLDQVVTGFGGAAVAPSAVAPPMSDAEQQARLGRLWEIVLASGGIAAASPGRDDIGREPPEFKEQAWREGPEPLARIEGLEPRAEGRRNSAADQERIQTIHDLSTEIGGLCHDDEHNGI